MEGEREFAFFCCQVAACAGMAVAYQAYFPIFAILGPG